MPTLIFTLTPKCSSTPSQAEVLTTPAVREKIQAKLAGKLAFWSPKMGANAPQKPIIPELLQGTQLSVDGKTIEVRGTTGALAHRPYVWIPSIKTIAGNIALFGNLHVWTADTQKASERQAWFAQLDEIMEALKPETVVPGHMVGRIGFAVEELISSSQGPVKVVRGHREMIAAWR